jgi:hypothetical protein
MARAKTKKAAPARVVTTVKEMKNYRNEPTFKKKEDDAVAFIKRNGIPKNSGKSKG